MLFQLRFVAESSITATHDSLIFSGVLLRHAANMGVVVLLENVPTEVHLKGAEPNQIRLFIDNLPTHITGKSVR